MKQMVRRRLESLGLNPSEHHIKDYNVKTVKARRQHNKNRHLSDFRDRQPQPARSPRINVFHEAAQQDYHFHVNPVNEGFEEPFV